jgi:ribosomal protein L16/L10AE
MLRTIGLLISLPCVALSVLPAYAQDRSVALVLDASGSMKAALPDGTTRIDAAKTAVTRLVTTLDRRTRLALRIYGDQSPTAKKDCKDTRVLGGFDGVEANGAGIVEQARAIQPQGYTPITYALTLAAQDLSAEEANSRVVVLVSDGKETCQGDPCAAAKALADADAKLVVHTVGVGVDAVTRGQLQCIARMARGSYFDANSAPELTAAIGKAAVEPVKKRELIGIALGTLKMKAIGLVEIFGSDGQKVSALTQITPQVRLAAGIYSVKFGKQLWQGVEIRPRETTELKPGYLEISPLGDPFVEVLEPETEEHLHRMFWLEQRKMLIPGWYDVKFGKLLWPGRVEVKPGETTRLRVGRLDIKSKLVMYVRILDRQGQEILETSSRRIALPPGSYVLEIDSRKFFKSLTDEQRRIPVELNADEVLTVPVE